MKTVQEQAAYYLNELRRGVCQYNFDTMRLREVLVEGGLTLGDVGTSEEELQQLHVLGCRVVASHSLEELRKGVPEYRFYIEWLGGALSQGCLSLEDVGTSDEELQLLRLLGSRVGAAQKLEILREGTAFYKVYLGQLHHHLSEGSLSLADIGTSNEELAQLHVLSCKTGAVSSLRALRKYPRYYDSFRERLEAFLDKGGLTLADIDSSEEEIEGLRPMQAS